MGVNQYKGFIEIIPDKKFMNAQLQLDYIVKEDQIDHIELFLYQYLNIENIIFDKMQDFVYEREIASWCPFVNESRRLYINLKEPVSFGELLSIKFNYSGTIEEIKWNVNRITDDLVELGLYAPWYPLLKDMDDAVFNLNIKLPVGYEVMNAKYREGYHHLVQIIPNKDCTIIASKRFKRIDNANKSNINVFYMLDDYKEIAEQVLMYANQVLDYYISTFGQLSHPQEISICMVARDQGGGYCRPGLIVIMHGHTTHRFLAHEIGHLWWINADVEHDWLNETFAEYSALMMIRESSKEEFERFISDYTDASQHIPPILSLKRDDEYAYVAFYKKGPVLIYQLEQKIGALKLIHLLQEMYKQKIKTSEEFFTLLENETNSDISHWLRNKLTTE